MATTTPRTPIAITPPTIAPTRSALFNFSVKSFAVDEAFKLGGSEGLFSLTKTIISGNACAGFSLISAYL